MIMEIFSGIKAMSALQKIKLGGTAKLSVAQITNLIISLSDAQRNLSPEKFRAIYNLYMEHQKIKTKISQNIDTYMQTAIKIIKKFDIIAPFEKYSGMDEFETKNLLMQIQNSEVLTKASGLVYGIKGSIGDVFFKLNGQKASIFSITAISSAVKYYLDKRSSSNPLFSEISNIFVDDIANDLSKNNDSAHHMIKYITSLSNTFEERVAITKNNFPECNEIELCGIAAAALYCNLQKDNIDLNDESTMEMYFEIFKTVFVKLIESL